MANTEGEMPELPSDADDEEALRYAITLSLQDQQKPATEPQAAGAGTQPKTQDKTAFGSLLLDRKAMEEERLKRLAVKRPRASSDDDVVEALPAKKKSALGSSSTRISQVDPPPSKPSLEFPDGAVKRTWAYGYPRTPDDIKIEEVLRKDRLELAVLSSYQWDDAWMLSKIDSHKTKLLLVAFAKHEAQQQEMRENAPSNVRFCFPPMNGLGSMHSKLQLLKYPDSLRIVVPTGNLVPYDWGETGVMENMVFLIDLPRLADTADHKPTTFSTELGRFLRASEIDEKMVSSLSNYDFSRTEQLGFVYTIPGGHMDEFRRRTGYCGLGECVAQLGLGTTASIEVDIVAASLGSINSDLVGAIYNACQGDNGMKEYNARAPRRSATKSQSQSQRLKEHFRIYFPAEQTVAKSRGGRGAAGTICVQAKWWRSPSFPTDLVRDCVSTREGLLMHSKTIFVRPMVGARTIGGTRAMGWAYVGSANLSESAWGHLVKDRKSGKPKMSCRNWECGVVVPVPNDSTPGRDKTSAITTTETTAPPANDMEVFGNTVPVPMRVPGRPYGPSEEPWFYAGAR